MKSILISIKPKYVADILNGRKTIEIRKTMPKCELPITVYIYCTKGQGLVFDSEGKGLVNSKLFPYAKNCPEHNRLINGKVVAKFTLNKVEEMVNPYFPKGTFATRSLTYETLLKQSCLTEKELDEYINKGSRGYAWCISNLVIFDKPKELSEFKHLTNDTNCKKCAIGRSCDLFPCDLIELTKAPQSWCYVESEE